MKSHSVCRVCSCHHVISSWHFLPGGFCLTTGAASDQFSELRTLSCRKYVFDNDVAIFNILGQILLVKLYPTAYAAGPTG